MNYWNKATDNFTSQADLQYRVFYSASNDVYEGVNAVETSATSLNAYQTNKDSLRTYEEFQGGSNYNFYVIVKDAAENKILYNIKNCQMGFEL